MTAALTLLVGCGGDDATPAPTAATEPVATTPGTTADVAQDTTIVIEAFVYVMPEAVPAGEVVTLRNEDHADHTVTADDGSFSVFVGGDDTVTFVAPSAGSYPFYCRVHPDMRSELRVV